MVFDAVLRADRAPLEQVMLDEFLMTYTDGSIASIGKYATKEQLIARWTNADNADPSAQTDLSQQRVLIAGDTAVVFGHIVDSWQEPDGEHKSETWVSDTWVRRAEGWRWLASHETFLQE